MTDIFEYQVIDHEVGAIKGGNTQEIYDYLKDRQDLNLLSILDHVGGGLVFPAKTWFKMTRGLLIYEAVKAGINAMGLDSRGCPLRDPEKVSKAAEEISARIHKYI